VITELRRYRIKPDRLASWVAFFHEAARRNEAGGSQVEFAGVDPDTSTFVWLRTYTDWTEREEFAMDHVIEYDVTFLETAIHREGGGLVDVPWPRQGERPGSRGDSPPDGWIASMRQAWVRGESDA